LLKAFCWLSILVDQLFPLVQAVGFNDSWKRATLDGDEVPVRKEVGAMSRALNGIFVICGLIDQTAMGTIMKNSRRKRTNQRCPDDGVELNSTAHGQVSL
jgi:hypothetical protein